MSGNLTNEIQSFKNSKIIMDNHAFRLHYFIPENPTTQDPIFVIPPHAGRHGCIAQNLIDKCTSEGRRAFAFELKPATEKTKDVSICDLILYLEICGREIRRINFGSKFGLIGLCQGAWLGAIYAAQNPMNISFYCNFAGPINTQTGQDNIIERYCRSASLDHHKALVEASGGLQLGIFQWMSFAMVNPKFVFVDRWLDFIKSSFSGDEEALKKWKKNNSWYDTPNDLAGKWFLECLENHFMENRLYEATWKIDNEFVYLSSIKCPVYLYAGEDDEITHPQQVFDMESVLGSKEVHKTLFSGAGHTKVFVGSDELGYFAKEVLRR